MIVAALFALLGAAAADPPAVDVDGWTIERREWRRDATGVSRVVIDNPWGDVRVRPAPGAEAYLLANLQRHEDDPRPIEVALEVDGALLRLTVDHAAAEDAEPAGWARRRADLTLFAPAAARLEVTTRHGLAEVRGATGPVRVRTDRGAISIVSSASVDAESVHGAIQADLRAARWAPASRFTTVNGDIFLTFARDASATVRIETRGTLTTDYSLTVDDVAESRDKTAVARIGGRIGGRIGAPGAGAAAEVIVRSTNGAVTLRRSSLRPDRPRHRPGREDAADDGLDP